MTEEQTEKLSLRLFGSFGLGATPHRESGVSAIRQRAVLAYLGARPAFKARRETLCALIWSEMDDRTARQNLRQTILRLKRELDALCPRPILIAKHETIELAADVINSDVAMFDHLIDTADVAAFSEALDLYAGEFLADFPSISEPFDQWAESERTRLRLSLGRIVERYIADPGVSASQAVAAANKALSFDVLDERSQRLLLQALARHYGDEAALAHAEMFVKQLQKELGVRPEDQTQALIAEIRSRTLKARPVALERAAIRTQAPAPDRELPKNIFENVPPRDLNFIGRDGGLTALDHFLRAQTTQLTAKHVAIHGLGGIGKTSLAAEFAYRYAGEYSGVWWARAPQRALLVNSLASLAAQMDDRLGSEPDHEKAATAALARMSRLSKPFLLIYDNVDSPETIQGLVPSIGAHVIITSRWVDWSGRAAELKLGVFDDEVAVKFLQKRAERLDPSGAQELAAALGHLPLALDHAGAYCRMTATSFISYLEKLDARLKTAPKGVTYHSSISATFRLAIEAAAHQHPAAESLLSSLAFFSPANIPLELVSTIFPHEEDRGEALAALYAASLIEHKTLATGGVVVTVHPLVQAAVRARVAERGETAAIFRAATDSLASSFPSSALSDPAAWQTCAMLLRHVLSLRQFFSVAENESPLAAQLLHSAGGYLHVRGSYREAEALYRQAMALGERALGRESSIVTEAQSSLALLLSTTGRYEEAEPLLRQAVANAEHSLGDRALGYAIRLNNLARLLSDTKRYEEAEPLYRTAIDIADSSSDESHVYSVAWRNNLGIVLNETNRNDEGEQLYRRALTIAEDKLGRTHHETARCLNNLARLLLDLKRYAEAESLVREALDIWHGMFGTDHALPARGKHNLASILLGMERAEEAREIAEPALYIHENTLGLAHFWTRDSARVCASAYAQLGEFDKAEAIRRRFGVSSATIASLS